MAWGSVVRQIAAGLGLELDELVETVERVAWDRDIDTVSGHIRRARRRRALRGARQGGRRAPVVLEHVTRTTSSRARVAAAPSGDGCYRVEIKGEPIITVDFAQHGNGDHNHGVLTTAMRLVNSVRPSSGPSPAW